VGLTAVECGKAIGATVIATARGADKLAVAKEHGADHVLDSEAEDIRDRVKELTGGLGADVVYDPVGGALFDASLRAVAWEGRIVVIGFASGTVPQIPANILLVKNAAVLGFYWGSYRRHDPERLRAGFRELFAWHGAGRIRPHVSTTLPLAETAEAIRLLAGRRSIGKIVVTVS
jgi:NADPH:quinone reductase